MIIFDVAQTYVNHFVLLDSTETRLMDADCPQEARLKARGKPCTLTYKRIATKSVWPSTSTVFH